MSSIVTEQGILHYESIGRGQPIILLHGWINSWDVWRDFMVELSQTDKYRIYALDFWGFGESAKGTTTAVTSFKINGYVEMVHQFMDTLGIQQAPVFGHSMGGTVALQMGLKYPDRVTKVAVVGSPVIGNSLNFFLRLAGYGLIARLVWRYPFMLHSVMRILLAGDSNQVRNMIFRDVQRTTIESFFKSISDLRRTDLRDKLPELKLETLAIHGVHDNIVDPTNARLIQNGVRAAHVAMMQRSRHFPMIDEPTLFMETLSNFLNNKNGIERPSQ